MNLDLTGILKLAFNLFNNLTVLENLTLAPVQLKIKSKEQAEEKAFALLKRIGLEDKANVYPSTLSGGQKQRISIARVFLKNPPILILDEATSALDEATEEKLLKNLRALQNRTCIIITHKPAALNVCNKEIRIDNKKMGLYQNEKAPFITELHKINYNIFQTSFLFTIFA